MPEAFKDVMIDGTTSWRRIPIKALEGRMSCGK